MAEDKKSFLLYVDLIHTIRKLPDDKAGILFKHILSYVNDENPIINDFVVDLTFEPIKQQLKRDLQKWDKHKADKSLNGRMGNLKRYHLDLFELVNSDKMNLEDAENVAKSRKVSLSDVSDRKTRLNVNDNVNVNVNVNDNVNDISFKEKNEKEISEKPVYKKVEKQTIEERKINFSSTLEPYLQSFGRDILNKFFLYWTEPNQKTNKMRFEFEKTWSIERRLNTWKENESKFTKPTFANNQNQDSKFVKSMKNALSANEILKQEYLDSLSNPNNE